MPLCTKQWFVKVQSLVPHLSNALMIEQREIPTASLQNLIEILPRRLEVIIAASSYIAMG